MILTNELRACFARKNMTQGEVGRKILHISENTMSSKMKKGIFSSDEIYALTKELDIENPISIFFADTVT